MAAHNSYVFQILRYLRIRQVPASLQNVFDGLVEAEKSVRSHAMGRMSLPKDIQTLREVMVELTEIGILRSQTKDGGLMSWEISVAMDADDARGFLQRNGIGGGGPGNLGPSDGEQDGRGGGGVSEVLAHPVLFCLDEDAQADALGTALAPLPANSNGDDRSAV